jgi:hypothetical protein
LGAFFFQEAAVDTRVSKTLAILSVLTISSIVASNLYSYAMAKWTAEAAYQMQQTLVLHTAEAPNRYRILVPTLVELLSRLVPDGVQPALRFLIGYFIYYQVSIGLSLVLLFVYLRQWYSYGQALVGILVAAVSMLVAFGDGYFQPWSLLEIGLFTAGLIAIYRSQKLWLAVIIILATLNRETGVFLVIAYGVLHLKRTKPFMTRVDLVWTGVYGAIWGSLFVAIRLWLGPAPQLSLVQIQKMNFELGALLIASVNGVFFLGAFWVFVWRGRKTEDPFIRATWRIVPIYLLPVVVFGVWAEIRLITPLYPILLSTGLSAWATTPPAKPPELSARQLAN